MFLRITTLGGLFAAASLVTLVPLPLKAADVLVSSAGGPGVFTTIGAALTAANAGDRILITPETFVETITITKSVTLLANAEGGTFSLQGGVTLAPAAPAIEVVVSGASIAGGVSAAAAPSGGLCRISILGCTVGSIAANLANYHVTLAGCNVNGSVTIKLGRVIGCTTLSAITISGDNTSSERTLVVGNIANGITLNTSNVFHVRNNFVVSGSIQISATATLTEGSTVENNTLRTPTILFPALVISCGLGANTSPVSILNNYIVPGPNTPLVISGAGVTAAFNTSLGSASFVNPSTGAVTDAAAVNGGHPGNAFLDLDLSRNDQGCYGGSWSRDNFDDAPGAAMTFLVDAPRQVIQGAPFSISAESFDR